MGGDGINRGMVKSMGTLVDDVPTLLLHRCSGKINVGILGALKTDDP